MRRALTKILLAVLVTAAPAAAAGTADAKAPTRAQIRAAVKRAQRSPALWATVNICQSGRQSNTIGIRGQMPALGFPAWLSMVIQTGSYSAAQKRFVKDPGRPRTVHLGRASTGLQQDGATFTFSPFTGRLDATVRFVWRRAGRLLGQATRRTTAGHPTADFGRPRHFSAAECRMR